VYIESLARTAALKVLPGGEKPKGSATGIVEAVEVFLPLKGIIDLEDERSASKRSSGKSARTWAERTSNSTTGISWREPKPRPWKRKGKSQSPFGAGGKAEESLARVQGGGRKSENTRQAPRKH